MSLPDRVGVRVRFLAAVAQASDQTPGPGRLCEACLSTLSVQRVAITVSSPDGGHEFLTASDEVAEQMEWTQITLGEGPSVRALGTGGPVTVPDAAAQDTPWPLFAREAAAAGVGPMYALPLQMGAIRVGVLSLYLEPPARLSNDGFDDAIAVADLITSILLAAGTTSRPDPLDQWWDQPLASREIHQATGMIVAQLDVAARDAFARLQAYAFSRSRLLDDVARDVVHGGLRIDPDPDDDPVRTP